MSAKRSKESIKSVMLDSHCYNYKVKPGSAIFGFLIFGIAAQIHGFNLFQKFGK